MRSIWILACICFLPGCAVLKTDCAEEVSALRQADAAIAHAERTRTKSFSVQLASRGDTTYHCVPGKSGQVRCSTTASARPTAPMEELYRARDAAAARVALHCDD